jgi:succinate dehydrogenase hydrophobic anchor subunit
MAERAERRQAERRHAERDARAGESRLRQWWRDYNLSIVVGILFLAAFVLHAIFGWWQYVADTVQHGGQPSLWGFDGYVIYFGEWTFQNWQSEFLEVYLLIVLTVYLHHKGSHESKEGEEEIKAVVHRIERRVEELAKEQR